MPQYRTLGHSGPDHDPVFTVEVRVGLPNHIRPGESDAGVEPVEEKRRIGRQRGEHAIVTGDLDDPDSEVSKIVKSRV